MKQYSDDRKAMALEIMETLKTRGHWVPKDFEGPDLIMAVGKALDGMNLQLDEQRHKYSDLLQSHASLCGKVEELRNVLKHVYQEYKDEMGCDCGTDERGSCAYCCTVASLTPSEKRICEHDWDTGKLGERLKCLKCGTDE